MRKILAITGLAMLLSGCGEKGDFESYQCEDFTFKAVLLLAG